MIIYRVCKSCKRTFDCENVFTKCEACRDRDQNYREREIQERMETNATDEDA